MQAPYLPHQRRSSSSNWPIALLPLGHLWPTAQGVTLQNFRHLEYGLVIVSAAITNWRNKCILRQVDMSTEPMLANPITHDILQSQWWNNLVLALYARRGRVQYVERQGLVLKLNCYPQKQWSWWLSFHLEKGDPDGVQQCAIEDKAMANTLSWVRHSTSPDLHQ
jgi:hypothetical protein